MSSDSSMRNDIWKWLSLLIIAVFSIYVTFPVKEKLRFGLDLKGGTSFTLGVDTDKLRETIIADNPSITNETGAIERKIQETLKGADARIIQVVRRRVDGMGPCFQFYYDMATQQTVVEDKVGKEFVVFYQKTFLSGNEGETFTHFK